MIANNNLIKNQNQCKQRGKEGTNKMREGDIQTYIHTDLGNCKKMNKKTYFS